MTSVGSLVINSHKSHLYLVRGIVSVSILVSWSFSHWAKNGKIEQYIKIMYVRVILHDNLKGGPMENFLEGSDPLRLW